MMDDLYCPVCKSAPLITDYCPNCSRIPDLDMSPTPLQLECERLRAEVAALKASVEYWASHAPTDAYVDQLLTAQANNARLLEALKHAIDVMRKGAVESPYYEKALATPLDDTALQDALKAERDKTADLFATSADASGDHGIAHWIRSRYQQIRGLA